MHAHRNAAAPIQSVEQRATLAHFDSPQVRSSAAQMGRNLFSDERFGEMRPTTQMKSSMAFALLSFAFLFSTESMAMFDYCIFSEVRGVVVSNGKPVVGAIIERSYHWTWKDYKGRDETRTNEKGEFHFPEATGVAVLGWLPHQAMIQQTISIKHEGHSYDAWLYTKSNYRANGELNGKPIVLNCTLEAPTRCKESGVPNRWVNGICELG